MDTNGFSQVGRYGTISLMKQQEPDSVVTSFGIDSEELTFGRDPTCSVRLYYSDVSLVHCKIIFEQRKAFLAVLGDTGLLVDGCQVFPSQSASGSPMTIPLSNNSEIEIHKKLFRFSYPPKELRAALLATPGRPQNRTLRLSMIHSALVFSPRPSKDPRENLRILQSPLKNAFRSPSKLSRTPTPTRDDSDDESEEEEIVLVDGNHPRVVEEEKDLVILEDVEVEAPAAHVHQPQPQYQPPQTPQRKRSLSRNTLHRAVLIRSAQRAVIKAEREREEEEEEMEVLAQAVEDAGESDEEAQKDGASASEEEQQTEEEEYDEDEDENEEEKEEPTQQQKSMWRKSLERIWPFRSSSPTKEEEEAQTDSENESEDEQESSASAQSEEDEDEEPTPLPARSVQTPIRRPLGSFMTPQVAQQRTTLFPHAVPQTSQQASRFSLGGGEARRVVVNQPTWKVKDIVVPLKGGDGDVHGTPVSMSSIIDRERQESPSRRTLAVAPQSSPIRPVAGTRRTLSEDERKAIQERRRSAVREVDNFFVGGVPGMTPSKPTSVFSRPSMSPSKPNFGGSPMKGDEHRRSDSADNEEDTRSLLDRMKETVEGMKRRRSMLPADMEATPQASVHGAPRIGGPSTSGFGVPATPTPRTSVPSTPRITMLATPRIGIPSTPRTGVRATPGSALAASAAQSINEEDENNENDENQPEVQSESFSLLRSGAREEVFVRRQSVVVLEVPLRDEDPRREERIDEGDDAMDIDEESLVPVEETPQILVDKASEEDIPPVEKPSKINGLARLSRPKKTPTPAPEEVKMAKDEHADSQLLKATSKGTRSRIPEKRSTEEIAEEKGDDTKQLQANARRNARSRTPQPDPTEDDNVSDVVPEQKPTTRRTRKAIVEPEELPAVAKRSTRKVTVESAESGEIPLPAPVRRGQKATVVPKEEAEPEVEKASMRRGRKTTMKGSETESEDAELAAALHTKRGRKATKDPASEPPPAAAEPVRKGRTPKVVPARKPRATKAKAVEVEAENDGDDPLDMISEEEVSLPEPTTKAKGKRKAVVKAEVQDDVPATEETPAPVATRAARSKNAAKPIAVATTSKTPAVKPRATRKTPTSAPAIVGGDEVDKENTPRSSRSDSGKSSLATPEEAVAVKVRVSRSKVPRATTTTKATPTMKIPAATRKPVAKMKQEVEEEPTRGRVMRGRARTKTT
ncbi:hypothetical protein BDQ12DRAFT_716574 [Crucibulum laeve]|uniref:FHA domain-containing protein n=1 Tax=Crucibulum laeve TaxID=68775 RepID=A0A5C3LTU3_9AGAR|nr:hypothetical protein BDQ12DRAFT_716574 [Crucibulum laeve]